MAACEVCGNDYDKSFEITLEGKSHLFDSFECAIHALAPTCPHCGCRIVGHGVEEEAKIFCCVHCARANGDTALKDRVLKKVTLPPANSCAVRSSRRGVPPQFGE